MSAPTILKLYALETASSVLSSANKFATAVGGTGDNSKTTKIGTASNWGQLYSQGNAGAWPALGAIGSPDGHGWFFDASTLDGQQLIGEVITILSRLILSVGATTATLVFRLYKYNGGVYTQIGSNYTLSAQALAMAGANYTFPTQVPPANTSFVAGDHGYLDAWMNITTPNGSAVANVAVRQSSHATLGIAGAIEVDLPGYEPAGTHTNTIGSSTMGTALINGFQHQCWLLPDNSLIVAYQAGTSGSFSSGNLILIQSSNWQTTAPTWTFVKQLDTNVANAARASLWWDAANTRLHCVMGTSASSGSAITYISATYSGGVWTWDSSFTTLPTSATSSVPVVCVDGNGVIFVAYRDFTTPNYDIKLTVYSSGSWQTPYIKDNSTQSNANTFASLLRSGTSIVLVTHEAGSYFACVHPDANAYNTWGSLFAGPPGYTITDSTYGPLACFSDASGSVWVSLSSSNTGSGGAKEGLSVVRATIASTNVTFGSVTQLDGSQPTIGAGEWTSANGLLYLFYAKSLSANNSNIVYQTYNGATWSTAVNITNAQANNNVNPVVPFNVPATTPITSLPAIYEIGTASPYYLELQTVPIVTDVLAVRTGLRVQVTKSLVSRFVQRVSATASLATRLRLLGQTLLLGTRTRLAVMRTRSAVLRARISVLTSRSLPVRAGVSVKHAFSLPLRAALRVSRTRSALLRTRLAVLTARSLPLRAGLRVAGHVSLALRTALAVQVAVSLPLRAGLRVMNSVTLALRLVMRVLVSKSIGVRIRLIIPRSWIITLRLRLRVQHSALLSLRFALSLPGELHYTTITWVTPDMETTWVTPDMEITWQSRG